VSVTRGAPCSSFVVMRAIHQVDAELVRDVADDHE